MKCTLTLLIVATALVASAQPSAKVFSEKEGPGYVLYARNPDAYPVSMRFTMSNTNLVFSEAARADFLVPAHSEKFRIGALTPAKANTSYRMNYRYSTCMGDVTARPQDTTYLLPFAKGAQFLLYQGYNGSFSHRGENSLDFTMPQGTPLRAARGGTVVEVVQSNDRHCATPDCKQYNNYITILHADGTFAQYAHIRKDGSVVKVGDAVRAGDPIGWSGDVGYTEGPHLHFAVFSGGYDKWTTWPTQFHTAAGIAALKEGTSYQQLY